MPAESARLLMVEDEIQLATILKLRLERAGFRVVLLATTLAQALESVPSLESRGISIAIIDGNLTKRYKDCREGICVAKEIKAKAPTVGIVGYSSTEEQSFVCCCHKFVFKGPSSFPALLVALRDLAK